MSSVTSTKAAAVRGRGRADTQVGPYESARRVAASTPAGAYTAGLAPWQFFVLAALGCATAVNVMARGQGVTTIILLTVLVASTALVGVAALRTLNPLITEEDDRTSVIGGRTRAALEREKMLVLRAIKELEFDRAMGKVSEADFEEMGGRMRTRAARLIRELDAGAGYKDQIERDLAKRLGADRGPAKASHDGGAKASGERDRSVKVPADRVCGCGAPNDADARFCKSCGAKL